MTRLQTTVHSPWCARHKTENTSDHGKDTLNRGSRGFPTLMRCSPSRTSKRCGEALGANTTVDKRAGARGGGGCLQPSPVPFQPSGGSLSAPPPPGDHEGSQEPLGPQGRTLLSSRSVSWNAEPKPRCCLNAPAKVTPSSSVDHTNNGLTLLSHTTLGRGSPREGPCPAQVAPQGLGGLPSAGGGGPALVESARLSHRCFAQFLRTEHECPPDAIPVQTQCARDAVVPSSLS